AIEGTSVTLSGLPSGVNQDNMTLTNGDKTLNIALSGNSEADYDANPTITLKMSSDVIEAILSDPVLPYIYKDFNLIAIIEPELGAPSGITYSFDGDDDGLHAGELVGVDSSMAFSLDGGTVFMTCTEDDMLLSDNQISSISETNDIKIRTKATLREPASGIFTIDISGQSAPGVTRDDTSNTISGITETMVYSIDGGTTWTLYSGTLPDLTGTITVKVRFPAHGLYQVSPATSLSFTVPAPPPPTPPSGGGGGALPPMPPVIAEPVIGTEVSLGVLTTGLEEVKVTVEAGKEDEPVVFSQDVLSRMNDRGVAVLITQANLSLRFPAGAIDPKVIARAGAGADLQLKMGAVSASAVRDQLNQAKSNDGLGLFSIAGLVFEFNAQLVSETKTTIITEFKKNIDITISLKNADLSSVDVDKLGVYWFNETTKTWDYIGGNYDPVSKTMTFSTGHFSIYSVLEYIKTFDDITTHWAKDSIEVMASRHIINGRSASIFDPDAIITRAEFTALVIRTLAITADDMPAVNQAPLVDILLGKWYSAELGLAASVGILPEDMRVTFNPDMTLSRAYMAVIIANGLALRKNLTIEDGTIDSDALLRFTDLEGLSDESISAIQFTVQEGLLNGRSETEFAPQGNLSRAEAATVIKRLLEKI
nr:S-layer homology domain-containing protein [Vallitaleaceae bacterium]